MPKAEWKGKTPVAEPSWIMGFGPNESTFEPLAHVHCARCGARSPISFDNVRSIGTFIDNHRECQLRVAPENFWREVWHDRCVNRGPMKRRPDTLTIEDGSILSHYECLGCGVHCFAGLNKGRYITTRPFTDGEAR